MWCRISPQAGCHLVLKVPRMIVNVVQILPMQTLREVQKPTPGCLLQRWACTCVIPSTQKYASLFVLQFDPDCGKKRVYSWVGVHRLSVHTWTGGDPTVQLVDLQLYIHSASVLVTSCCGFYFAPDFSVRTGSCLYCLMLFGTLTPWQVFLFVPDRASSKVSWTTGAGAGQSGVPGELYTEPLKPWTSVRNIWQINRFSCSRCFLEKTRGAAVQRPFLQRWLRCCSSALSQTRWPSPPPGNLPSSSKAPAIFNMA